MTLSKAEAIRQQPIRDAIQRSPVFVERCLVALLDRQTEDEQVNQTTSHSNGVGFSGVHAEFGTSMAQQIQRNKYQRPEGQILSIKQRPHAQRMVLKYVRQLADHADSVRQEAGIPSAV